MTPFFKGQKESLGWRVMVSLGIPYHRSGEGKTLSHPLSPSSQTRWSHSPPPARGIGFSTRFPSRPGEPSAPAAERAAPAHPPAPAERIQLPGPAADVPGAAHADGGGAGF